MRKEPSHSCTHISCLLALNAQITSPEIAAKTKMLYGQLIVLTQQKICKSLAGVRLLLGGARLRLWEGEGELRNWQNLANVGKVLPISPTAGGREVLG